MRNLLLPLALSLATHVGLAQSLQRDNLLGLHPIDVELNPGVTMEEFATFFVDKVLPEYEKHWVGLKGHLIQSVRGEYQNQLAIVWVFATEPTRDHYFNTDGSPNELEMQALDKVKPIEEELKKNYGSYTVNYQDDWVVQ